MYLKNVYFNKSQYFNGYDETLFSKNLVHRHNTKDTLIENINCSRYIQFLYLQKSKVAKPIYLHAYKKN